MLKQGNKKSLLNIKTRVVKRTWQELNGYTKEANTQQLRIEKMIEDGKNDHDIRKQKEVLQESLMMIPDCKKRLAVYKQELEALMKEGEDEEELEQAREVLKCIQ
jgi:tubulin-specific chaperone A